MRDRICFKVMWHVVEGLQNTLISGVLLPTPNAVMSRFAPVVSPTIDHDRKPPVESFD